MRRVVVTGAGGKTGRAVIAALAGPGTSGDVRGRDVRGRSVRGAVTDGVRVRALVRTPSRVADLDVEVVVGDQRRVEDVTAAVAGADAVYAIAPNVSPHEVEMGEVLLEACRRAGTRRVVFHSVVHPQLSAMPHHADKGRVEEQVIGSGLDWTILQPNAYLQNVAGELDGLRAGTYRVPYRPDAGLALVDLHDVAEVAARCLVGPIGVHATFELSGPEEVTGHRIAEVAADLLGRPVRAERLDPAAWARDQGVALGEVARDRLLAMFADYDRHGSPGDATVLTALLGREPRDLRVVLGELLRLAG